MMMMMMMAKLMLCMLCFVLMAEATVTPDPADKYKESKQEECSHEFNERRDKVLNKALCGKPKNLLVNFASNKAHELVTPNQVWIKKCVGICIYGNEGDACISKETNIIEIPVKVFNVETYLQRCANFAAYEDVSCHCGDAKRRSAQVCSEGPGGMCVANMTASEMEPETDTTEAVSSTTTVFV